MSNSILTSLQSIYIKVREIPSKIAVLTKRTKNLESNMDKILKSQEVILEYVQLKMIRERHECDRYSFIYKDDIVMFREGFCDKADSFRLFKITSWTKMEEEILVIVEPLVGDKTEVPRQSVNNFHKINTKR